MFTREEKEMRILIVGDYPPPHGGISTHVLSVADRIKRLGGEVEVLDIGVNRRVCRHGCVPVKGYVDYIRKVLRYLKRGYLIHIQTNGHNTKSWVLVLVSSLLAKFSCSPCITTLHSGITPSFLEHTSYVHRFVIRLSLKMNGKMICVSDSIREAIERLEKRPDRLCVIPAFVGDIEREIAFCGRAAKFMEEHSPVISTVAHFSAEYGIPLIINAVQQLKMELPRVGLLLIGEGDEKNEIETYVNERSLQNNFLALKSLNHGKCLYSIRHSDLFVRPSLVDGDSIAVREAVYLGTPVVASDAVPRPAQVVLFKSGDAEDLKEKISMVLEKGREAGKCMPMDGRDNFVKILSAYEEVTQQK